MKDEYLGSQKLILVFCQTFARYDYELKFLSKLQFWKAFLWMGMVSIRYFDFKCHTIFSTFRKTNMQWALMPKGDKCLQKQPKDNFFVISAYDI